MDKLKQQVYDELERRGAITDAQNPVVNELARRGVIRPLPMRVSDDILRAWGTDKKRGITPEVHYWRVRDNKKATLAERLWADEWKRRFGEPERPLPGPRITRSDTAVDRQLRESAAKFMSIIGSAGHPGSRGVPTTQTVSGVGELAQALSAVKPVVYGAISGMRPSEAPPTWIEALTQRVMPNAALLSQRPPNESTLQGILRGAASTLATFPEPENIGIMKAAGMIAGPLASAIARGAGPARAIPQAMRPAAATATHLAPMGYFTAEAGRGAVEQSKQGDTAGALGTMLGMLAPLILGGGAYALARKRAAAQAKPASAPEPAKPAGPEPQPAGPVKPAPETPPDVLTGATTVAPPEARAAQAQTPQATQTLQPTHKIGETPVVKVGGRWREVTPDGKTGRERRQTQSKPLVPIEPAKAGGPPVAEPVRQHEPTAVAQPSAKQEPQVVPNEPVKTEPVGGPPRAEGVPQGTTAPEEARPSAEAEPVTAPDQLTRARARSMAEGREPVRALDEFVGPREKAIPELYEGMLPEDEMAVVRREYRDLYNRVYDKNGNRRKNARAKDIARMEQLQEMAKRHADAWRRRYDDIREARSEDNLDAYGFRDRDVFVYDDDAGKMVRGRVVRVAFVDSGIDSGSYAIVETYGGKRIPAKMYEGSDVLRYATDAEMKVAPERDVVKEPETGGQKRAEATSKPASEKEPWEMTPEELADRYGRFSQVGPEYRPMVAESLSFMRQPLEIGDTEGAMYWGLNAKGYAGEITQAEYDRAVEALREARQNRLDLLSARKRARLFAASQPEPEPVSATPEAAAGPVSAPKEPAKTEPVGGPPRAEKPATAPAPEVEPWQMTRAEYAEHVKSQAHAGKALLPLSEHRVAVSKALREGKPVPEKVLADYPDLAKGAADTAQAETRGGPEVAEPAAIPSKLVADVYGMTQAQRTEKAVRAKYGDAAVDAAIQAGDLVITGAGPTKRLVTVTAKGRESLLCGIDSPKLIKRQGRGGEHVILYVDITGETVRPPFGTVRRTVRSGHRMLAQVDLLLSDVRKAVTSSYDLFYDAKASLAVPKPARAASVQAETTPVAKGAEQSVGESEVKRVPSAAEAVEGEAERPYRTRTREEIAAELAELDTSAREKSARGEPLTRDEWFAVSHRETPKREPVENDEVRYWRGQVRSINQSGIKAGWPRHLRDELRDAKRELDDAFRRAMPTANTEQLLEDYASYRYSNYNEGLSDDTAAMAEAVREAALREGKPIPPEVLTDYPDLAKGASNAVTEQGATPVGSVKGGPEGARQAQAEGVARSGQGPETAGAKEAGQGPVATTAIPKGGETRGEVQQAETGERGAVPATQAEAPAQGRERSGSVGSRDRTQEVRQGEVPATGGERAQGPVTEPELVKAPEKPVAMQEGPARPAPEAKSAAQPMSDAAMRAREEFEAKRRRARDLEFKRAGLLRDIEKVKNKPRLLKEATAALERFDEQTREERTRLANELDQMRNAFVEEAVAFDPDLARVVEAQRESRANRGFWLKDDPYKTKLAKSMTEAQEVARARAAELGVELNDEDVIDIVETAIGWAAYDIENGKPPRLFAETVKLAAESVADARIKTEMQRLISRRPELTDDLITAVRYRGLGPAVDERARLLKEAEARVKAADEADAKADIRATLKVSPSTATEGPTPRAVSEPVKAQQGQQGGAKAPAEPPTQTSYVPPKLPTYEEATAKPPPMDSAGHASWRDDIILAAKREGVPFTQVADFFERLKLRRESVYEGIKRDYPEIAEKWRKETFGAKREAEYQKLEKDLAREDAAEERRAAREAAAEEREEMLEGLKTDLSNERENLAQLNKDLKTAETPAERKEITGAIEASEAEIARLTQEIADVKKGKGGSRSQQALKDAQDMVGMEITPDRQPEPPITTTDVETAFPGSRVTQEGNTWTVETPNGRRFNIRVEESVRGQGGELAGALVVFESDGARQSVPADGFILLSQSAGAGKGVLNHEAFHAAWRFALTDEQRAVLMRAFGSEEQAALHYGRTWDSIGARPRGVFETIKRWASRIVERIVKPTQARSRRILENVKSGEVWGGGPPSLRRPNAEGIGPFDLWLGNPLSVGPRKGGPRIPGTLERFAGETGARASDIAVTLNHQAVTQLADWFNEARAVMETASYGLRGRRARLEARRKLAEAVELPRDDPRRAQIDAELGGAVTHYANLMENARQYIIRTLRELGRDVPDDWGVDSYMPHLFSGDIQLYDVKTGRALGWFENILQAERAWNDLTDAQKATTGLRFFERRMPGMQYVRASARNIAARNIAEATELTPGQVMGLMRRGRIAASTEKTKFAGFLQKRRGTEGYRTDIDRVTEDYLAQVVRWAELSKLQRRWQPIIDSVGQHNPTVAMYMQEYLDYRWAKPTLSEMAFGNAVARTPVLNKLAKGNPDFYTRRMVRFLTAMTHQTTINWNVISAATNGTQPLQTMYPFLRGGMKELVSYYNRLPRNFARLKRAGVFRTGTKLETVFDPFSREVIKSPYGAWSDLNRGVGYLWGEDLAKRWNAAHPDDPIDLHEAGLDMARWVEFDNTINAPKAFWNVIGRLLTQYKGFPVNMVNVMRYLATRHAGETLGQPIERMTRFGAVTVAHGGVKAALPFLGAKMLWDGAMRVASEITDDKKQQEAIAKVAVFGLPALIGFDQSMRVAFLDMMPESSVEGTVGKFVLGPTLGKAVRLYSGTKRAITAKGEDRQRVVSQTASAVVQPVRSALAAHRLLSGKGNKYPMGKQDIEVSPWANIVSILGGTPIETSVARAKGGAKEESYTVGGKSSKGGKPSNLIMPGRRSGSRKW